MEAISQTIKQIPKPQTNTAVSVIKSVQSQNDYYCEKCHNVGGRFENRNGESVFVVCGCEKIRIAIKRMKRSGLGDLVKKCTFDNYEVSEFWQEDSKRKAVEFLNNGGGKWFFAGGQVGAGKTHLCTAIASGLLKRDKTVRYMLWKDESTKLKGLINKEPDYSNVIGEFKKCDVLYIDDFLKTKAGESPSNGDINIAFELINYRYNDRNLITIISSERLIEEICAIDEATGSRITQRAAGNCLEFERGVTSNYRMRKGGES